MSDEPDLSDLDGQELQTLQVMAEAPSKTAPPPAEISPELRSMIEIVHGIGVTEPALSILHRRALMTMDTHAEMDVSVKSVDAGGVPGEWIVADGVATDRSILHLHGGAYTGGGLGSHRGFLSWMSKYAGCAVLSVDYRLAPEDPFPAGLDDAEAAYRWLTAPGAMATSSVVVSGDSAGGGLAAALILRLRDTGQPQPAGMVLISPWTDLALTGESAITENGRDPMCATEVLAQSAEAYVSDGVALDDPRVSPLYAELGGLPPTLIHVGEVEVLRDDSVRFAERALAAGTEVELLVAPGMVHVWHTFAGVVPEADRDLTAVGQWVRRHQRAGTPFVPDSSGPVDGVLSTDGATP